MYHRIIKRVKFTGPKSSTANFVLNFKNLQAYWATKILNMNLETDGEKRMLQLNELEEFQQDGYESSRIYKEKTKVWHDKHLVKNEFKPGQ